MHSQRRGVLSALAMTAAAAVCAVSIAGPAHAADPLPTPTLHYTFDSAPTSGNTITNAAGGGNDATLVGNGATFSSGSLVLPGGASNSGAAYVSIPNAAFLGQHQITTSIWLKNTTGSGNYAAAYVGNTSTNRGYWLFNPSNPSGYVKSVLTTATAAATSTSPWATEVGPGSTNAATSGRTSTGELALYTTVIDGNADTLSLYVNGALVSTTPVTADISNYNATTTDLVAYIGKSSYADIFLKGSVDDYAVYQSALTATQVSDIYNASVLDRAANAITVQSSATSSFTLPISVSGATVSWTSNSPAITIDNTTGITTINRPVGADAAVTLTAHIVAGSQSTDRTFAVTVPQGLPLAERVQQDLDAIAIANADDIRTNFTVPSVGALGSTIDWTIVDGGTASPALVAGVSPTTKTVTVARPAAGTSATTVTLKATVTNGSATQNKNFTVTVSPIETDGSANEAYVWAYFTGEGAGAERVSLAASKGNDALSWNTLNDGEPLFTSTLGTMGLRDPFILKSHDGDKFFMLATDLKVAGLAGGFTTAQISGSKYMEIYESTDLVTWTPQRHVKVSTDYAGNTWAPEAYWDDAIGKYVVYWASNLYPTTDASSRSAVTYNRMMYVTTDDFATFSEPKIWIDVQRGTGKGTIDVTVAEEDGTYYRFYKDEAANTIREEKSTDLLATVANTLPTTAPADKWSLVKAGVASGLSNGVGLNTFTAGEGPTVFPSNEGDVNNRDWFLFIDQPDYHGGPNHYIGFANDDLNDPNGFVSVASKLTANLPQNSDGGKPRHGTVIPVTRAQYQAVLEGYAPNLAVTSIDAISVSTAAGTAPALPGTASLHLADGSDSSAAVIWDTVAPSKYATGGTSFTVKGIAQDDSRAPVEATVNVALSTIATATPSITGTAKVGSTFGVDTGSWTQGTTFGYQWNSNGSAIAGATGSTYAVTAANAGASISVTVTGTATGYTTASVTSAGATIAAGDLTGSAPTISGVAKLGNTLTASSGTWGPATVGIAYQWLRNGVAVPGATAASYLLGTADVGAALSVTVTASAAGYATAVASSAPTAPVAAGTLTGATPKITGSVKVGKKLTAKPGTWKPSGVKVSYTWYRSGKAIKGATKATYTLKAADKGKTITVKVTGKKTGYTTLVKTSKKTKKVAR